MPSEDLQRIGEILIEEGAILAEEMARASQESRNPSLMESLNGAGLASRMDMARFLAATYQIPHVSIAGLTPAADVLGAIPREMAERHEIVPIDKAGGILFVAKANYFNRAAVIDVRKATGLKVKVLVAPEHEIQTALKQYYGVVMGEGVQVAAPIAELPVDVVAPRPTGVTKKYTAPGRTAALTPHDRVAMLFTEDFAPAHRNGGPTSPLKAIPISKDDYQLAERALHIDHIRMWEKYYAGGEPLPAVKMSR